VGRPKTGMGHAPSCSGSSVDERRRGGRRSSRRLRHWELGRGTAVTDDASRLHAADARARKGVRVHCFTEGRHEREGGGRGRGGESKEKGVFSRKSGREMGRERRERPADRESVFFLIQGEKTKLSLSLFLCLSLSPLSVSLSLFHSVEFTRFVE